MYARTRKAFALLTGLLLPAVQKVREAAARNSGNRSNLSPATPRPGPTHKHKVMWPVVFYLPIRVDGQEQFHPFELRIQLPFVPAKGTIVDIAECEHDVAEVQLWLKEQEIHVRLSCWCLAPDEAADVFAELRLAGWSSMRHDRSPNS